MESLHCKICHLLKKMDLGSTWRNMSHYSDLDIRKKVIEASSFQLAHSKFILPNYAFYSILLMII